MSMDFECGFHNKPMRNEEAVVTLCHKGCDNIKKQVKLEAAGAK